MINLYLENSIINFAGINCNTKHHSQRTMDEVTDHYLQNLKQEYDVDIHEDHGSHHEEAEGDDHSRDEITQHIGREGITQEIEQHIGREGSPQRIPMTLPEKLQDGEEHSDSGNRKFNC